MNAVTVIERKPRIGTDCRMSSSRDQDLLGASRAGPRPFRRRSVKPTDSPSAMNMRDNDRSA